MSTVSKVLEKKGNEILSVSPNTPVFAAIEEMAERSAGTALVMENDQLIGIISERDFIRKVYLQGKCRESISVSEIMSTELTVVSPDDLVEDCMNAMTEKRIRHLPVSEEGKIVGVISIGDIVKFMAEQKEFEVKNLQSYIAGPGL